jgi:hypothetical protein
MKSSPLKNLLLLFPMNLPPSLLKNLHPSPLKNPVPVEAKSHGRTAIAVQVLLSDSKMRCLSACAIRICCGILNSEYGSGGDVTAFCESLH